MPITFAQPMPAGTAIRLIIEPSADARAWRILRRTNTAFAGPDDPDAAVVLDSSRDRVVVDANFLRNGQEYHYRLFERVGSAWTDAGGVKCTPSFGAFDASTDTLMFVRDRLDEGLSAMVARGALPYVGGGIAVLTAPPTFDETEWPVVTVHLGNDASGERGLGELVALDSVTDSAGMVTEYEGWLARTSLTIVAWSLNPDERILLRMAIKSLVTANLPVFEAHGILQVDLSQDDTEDFSSFDAPIYQCISTFRCLAFSAVGSQTPAVKDISMSINPAPQQVRGFAKPYPPINKLHFK